MKRSHWEVESLPVLGMGGRFAFFQKALGTGHRRKAARSSHSKCLNLPSASAETRHPCREAGLQTMNIFCVPCWQSNWFRVRDWLGATWEWLLFCSEEYSGRAASEAFLSPVSTAADLPLFPSSYFSAVTPYIHFTDCIECYENLTNNIIRFGALNKI